MILSFFRNPPELKVKGDYMSIDGGHLYPNKLVGCDSMFAYARRFNGIFISDREIEGWGKEWDRVNDYPHFIVPGYGSIAGGALNHAVMKAIKFKGFKCWAMGDHWHRVTALLAKEHKNDWTKAAASFGPAINYGKYPDGVVPKEEGVAPEKQPVPA